MPSRTVALLMSAAFVAVACGAPSPSPGPGPTGSPPSTPTPDPADLRVPTDGWSTDFTIASVDLLDFVGGGPPRDGIPVIDQPRFESIASARTWLADTTPVIALEIDGAARAYPLAVLVWHEIVNDTLGGVPVAVTFCPLCHTALVFERTVDGTTIDLGTTGNLRYLDLVMYDRQTESWWQQATGEAIVGTLTGARLRFLPSQIVSLADFAATHPDAEVLSRDTGVTRPYGENPYPGLDRADRREFAYVNQVDHRLEAKERVVTLDLGGAPLAIPYEVLEERGVVEIARGSTPIVVAWVPGTTSALDRDRIDLGRDVGATGAFESTVDGRLLAFRRATPAEAPAAMVDSDTGSTWSITGRATSGPLAGARLTPVLHGDHFWFAWATFAPDTEIWGRS